MGGYSGLAAKHMEYKIVQNSNETMDDNKKRPSSLNRLRYIHKHTTSFKVFHLREHKVTKMDSLDDTGRAVIEGNFHVLLSVRNPTASNPRGLS